MTDIDALTTAERRRVADWLEQLPAEAWAKQSLCEGWTVADTVGHITFPWRVSTMKLMGMMIRHMGYNKAARLDAPRLAAIGPEALIAEIRENAEDVSRPPGTEPQDLLAEVVIHPLDIGVPTGVLWEPDPVALREMLDYITTHKKGTHYHPDGGIAGQRYEAIDLDWSWGEGPSIQAPASQLLLQLTGR